MKVRKILQQEEEIDHETGEITKTKHTLQFTAEPNYVKLYLDCLGTFTQNEGLEKSLNALLIETLQYMTFANKKQQVYLNSEIKSEICEKTGKSIARYNQALTTWVKEGILKRVGRGTYKVNPWIFGKGDWRDIEHLRTTFYFDEGKLTIEKTLKIQNENSNEMESKTESPSNAPDSPTTLESPQAQEKVPAESKKPQNEPNFAEFELPELTGEERWREFTERLRRRLFRQFCEQQTLFEDEVERKRIEEIFRTKTDSGYWEAQYNVGEVSELK